MKTLNRLKKWILYEYNSIHNYISFWYAKRKANKMHKLTGKRYHVVPGGKRLMVVNNTFINHYNKAVKSKSKMITIADLLKMSYYSTPVEGINRKKPMYVRNA